MKGDGKRRTVYPIRTVKIEISEDLILALDLKKTGHDMNRSAFARYVLRKGFESIGVSSEDIDRLAAARFGTD